MKKTVLVLHLGLFLTVAQSQGIKANIFAHTPGHLIATSLETRQVYDTRSWKFTAGAPIRSTPLVTTKYICFGTTAGDFYSIARKTGELKWKRSFGYAINSSAAELNGKIFF